MDMVSSFGSQSENTDSTKTVIESNRTEKPASKSSSSAQKGRFIVGGVVMSPRTSNVLSNLKYPVSDANKSSNIAKLTQPLSLPSMTSFDSTQFPESSEYITSPTALSVSSMASSRKLEWDSGADLGYLKNSKAVSSLSTLERLAIGNSTSYLSLSQGICNERLHTRYKKKTRKKSTLKAKHSKHLNRFIHSQALSSSSEEHKSVTDLSNHERENETFEGTKCALQKKHASNAVDMKKCSGMNCAVERALKSDIKQLAQVCELQECKVPIESQEIKIADYKTEHATKSKDMIDSMNSALQNLSIRLKKHMHRVAKKVSNPELEHYKRIQDYISFVGMPSTNSDEINQKQSIAEVIVTMLGQLEIDTEGSSFSSSSIQQTSDHSSSLPASNSTKLNDDANQELNIDSTERCTTPGGSVVCAPYRPPTSLRTYYFGVNEDCQVKVDDCDELGVSEKDNSIDCEIALSQQLPDGSRSSSVPHEENTGLYQDYHGNMHIAHQPPGYNADSQSTCSSDISTKLHLQPSDLPNDEQNPMVPRLWTSTGSESAYETIREKDRNIEEAVASSFEFYSTSPPDPQTHMVQLVPSSYQSETTSNESCNRSFSCSRLPVTKIGKNQPLKTSSPMQDANETTNTSNSSSAEMKAKLYVKTIKKYMKALERVERRLEMRSAQNSRSDRSSTLTFSFRKPSQFEGESKNLADNPTGEGTSDEFQGMHRIHSNKGTVSSEVSQVNSSDINSIGHKSSGQRHHQMLTSTDWKRHRMPSSDGSSTDSSYKRRLPPSHINFAIKDPRKPVSTSKLKNANDYIRDEKSVQTGASLLNINAQINHEKESTTTVPGTSKKEQPQHSESHSKKSVKLFIPLEPDVSQKGLHSNQTNGLSLQDALSIAKPSYIKAAERRRVKINRKMDLRKQSQEHNHEVLAELPDNLKTQSVLKKFLVKNEESPLFNYRTMRLQNKRLYNLLPDSRIKSNARLKVGIRKTNRLMSTMYSQKLRRKVLRGKVSHGHQHVVTPSN